MHVSFLGLFISVLGSWGLFISVLGSWIRNLEAVPCDLHHDIFDCSNQASFCNKMAANQSSNWMAPHSQVRNRTTEPLVVVSHLLSLNWSHADQFSGHNVVLVLVLVLGPSRPHHFQKILQECLALLARMVSGLDNGGRDKVWCPCLD